MQSDLLEWLDVAARSLLFRIVFNCCLLCIFKS
uniref:Uncharacterized protein n=1 Tax=Anguilla anguilla TaxID=7936 RepID=A0A0E9PMV0_ANGAN